MDSVITGLQSIDLSASTKVDDDHKDISDNQPNYDKHDNDRKEEEEMAEINDITRYLRVYSLLQTNYNSINHQTCFKFIR